MSFWNLNRLTYLWLAASLCMTSSNAEAILASVKTTGMAATGISYPQDALAAAFNPAGMALVGNRFDIGLSWGYDSGKARIHDNLNPAINGNFDGMRTKNVYTPDFGINFMLGCDCNMSIGLVGYNRNYQKTTYKRPLALLGTSKPGLEYIHETISPVFAFKIGEKHALGISINLQLQRAKVNGIQNFDNPLTSSSPGNVTNNGYDYSHGWGVTFGWRWQVTECVAFGLTYQPETRMDKFHKYQGVFAQHGRINIPRKIGAGISWRFIPCATLAFDIEQIHWHPIRALHNPLTLPPPLGNGEQLGESRGAGFGFRDQMYYRVGVDYALNDCWILRAGFRHASTPIRRTQTAVNILTLDTVEDFLTLGATWIADKCNEISSFFCYGFNKKIKGKHSIPTALGGGNADLKEHKLALGLSWGRMF